MQACFTKVEAADESAFSDLAYATSKPPGKAWFRVKPEDFFVEEQIAFELSGEGEHLWLWVEKVGENSDWVAGALAKWANVSRKNIGMAGQKDRHAVTRQWFSVTLPGKPDPDLSLWPHSNVRILKTTRHQRKLQRGGLSGNRFVIRLRHLQSELPVEAFKQDIEQRLHFIQTHGVPNYFGEQRFGHYGNNLKNALAWLLEGKKCRVSRNQKSLYLSAMRSWMFNQYLSFRVQNHSWDHYIDGDVLNLEGSSRWFVETEEAKEKLEARVQEGDLHPTGPLLGDGDLPSLLQAGEWEQALSETYRDWVEALKPLRLQQDRRALRVMFQPDQLNYQWLNPDWQASQESLEMSETKGEDLRLEFRLPSGCFATMVLREVIGLMNYHAAKPLVKAPV